MKLAGIDRRTASNYVVSQLVYIASSRPARLTHGDGGANQANKNKTRLQGKGHSSVIEHLPWRDSIPSTTTPNYLHTRAHIHT